jgi:ABC-type branched-subunit amino acid transport system permease subunit
VRHFKEPEEESAGSMFLVVLEGMVYTVGAIFGAAALYLLHRWWNGQSVPFVGGFDSALSEAEFEMRPTQRMPVTPDEFRT